MRALVRIPRPDDDLADVLLAAFAHANRDQQPFPAGSQHEIANAFFRGPEMIGVVARLQNESREIAKAVEDDFANFTGHTVQFSIWTAARYARIVRRGKDQSRIDAQSTHLVAQLTN